MTKTRKILSVLTSLTCLTSAVSVPAGATLFSEPADYESMFTYEKLDDDEDGTYDFIRILKGGASATEVNIPDEIDGLPVTHIFDSAFYGIDTLTSINISESIENMGYRGIYNTSLESINVAEGNPEYSSEDGVLFDKEKTMLQQYPSSKADEEYTVPDSVTAIMGNAFEDCKNLKNIIIPENVTYVGNEAFIKCEALESITFENPDCQFNQVNEFAVSITNGYVDGKGYFNGVIYGHENSTAQAYAEKYDYNFEIIGTEPQNTKPVVTTQVVTSSSMIVTTAINISCENCGSVMLSADDVVMTPLGMKICKDCSKIGVGGTTAAPRVTETTETTISTTVKQITDVNKINEMLSAFISESDLNARTFIDKNFFDGVIVEIQEYWNEDEIKESIMNFIAKNLIDETKVEFVVLECVLPEDTTDEINWEKVLYGDNNCDSDISIADTITLSKYILNQEMFPLKNATAKENADCSYDSIINSKDVSKLLEYNIGTTDIMSMGPTDKSHCKMYCN